MQKHKLFLVILLSLSALAQAEKSSAQNKKTVHTLSETEQVFYDSLHNANCSIPEGTQVVHYPMAHKVPISSPSPINRIIVESVSYSQWNAFRLASRYPEALVFEESLAVEDMDRILIESSVTSNISSFLDETAFDNIKNAVSFEELLPSSKNTLYNSGAFAALLLGFIEHIYPSTLITARDSSFPVEEGMAGLNLLLSTYANNLEQDFEDAFYKILELRQALEEKTRQYSQEESPAKKAQIKESFRNSYQEMEALKAVMGNFLFKWRENLLFESVSKTLSEKSNQGKRAILMYGFQHNLSDDFKDYNFYRMPISCAIDPDNLPINILALFGLSFNDGYNTSFHKKTLHQLISSLLKDASDDFFQIMLDFSTHPVFASDIIPSGEGLSVEEYKLLFMKTIETILLEERWEQDFEIRVFSDLLRSNKSSELPDKNSNTKNTDT